EPPPGKRRNTMNAQQTTTGKIAVVTGGASGIGLATVKRLQEDGHTVVIVDRSEAAASVAQELSKDGARPVFSEVADLGTAADIERVTAVITATYGSVDILVNNAGIHPKRNDGSHFPIEE